MTLTQAMMVPEFWYGLTAIVAMTGTALAVVVAVAEWWLER